MAVEDGKVMEFTPEMLKEFAKLRHASFTAMMNQCAEDGWEIVPLREEGGFTARLAVKQPHDTPRGMLIICAGGAFMFKSYNEARPVAEFFYEKGINTAILDYHVNPDRMMGDNNDTVRMAGEDGLEAIRYIRANAAKYNTLPDHIAIGGFSAGGMLTGYAATKFDYGDPEAAEELKRVSSRPDAALILYGAFSRTSSIASGTGGMSREEIAAANELDNVRNIRVDCPPMFVFQTHGDDPRIALNFCMELAVHGVPYEIHTFEDGPHGGGLYNGKDETPDVPHTAMWAEIAADWLLHRGF